MEPVRHYKNATILELARVIHRQSAHKTVEVRQIFKKTFSTSESGWSLTASEDECKAGYLALELVIKLLDEDDGIFTHPDGRCFKFTTTVRQRSREGHLPQEFLAFEDYRPEGGGYNRPYLVANLDGSLTVQDSCHNCFTLSAEEVVALNLTTEQQGFLSQLFADCQAK
jgi:hypothetical protein